MENKKGKKGKQKKVDDPSALTHQERVSLQLQIETTRNKIQWRQEKIRKFNERSEQLLEKHAQKVASRAAKVEAMENSMKDRRRLHAQIDDSIPLMERQRSEAKARRLREVATEVHRFSREHRAHAAQAEEVRAQIGVEERHDVQAAAKDIAEMEAQLAASSLGGGEEACGREDFLRSEMNHLFAGRMKQHQTALRGSVDPINLKISEETRWYRDSEHLLSTEKDRLRHDTLVRAKATHRATESIAGRKEATRAVGAELRALKGRSSELEGRNQELRSTAEADSKAEAECDRLRSLCREAKERLRRAKEKRRGQVLAQEEKEKELAALAAELERVREAGRFLEGLKEHAEEVIRGEMERSPLDMLDGPSNVVKELVEFLEKSAPEIREKMRT